MQVGAGSKADVIVHGIQKAAHSAPSVIYKQAAEPRERDTWRERCQRNHMEGNTPDKDEGGKKANQNWELRSFRHRENRRLS